MTAAPLATVAALYRYPVKGLTPELLERVEFGVGETMPLDRAWAIENGVGRFDESAPRHLPKINFLMLMRNERLASLEARLDDATQVLSILRGGRQVARGDLGTPLGRKLIEQFLAAYLPGELRGAPRIVSAPGHSFSDVDAKCLHIINLSSVAALERVAGRPLDPLRFRANVHVMGLEAWVERGWVGRRLRAGGIELEVIATTTRCEATTVDPATAQRDVAVPALLQRSLGHSDFGIYARVIGAGALATGDPVAMTDS